MSQADTQGVDYLRGVISKLDSERVDYYVYTGTVERSECTRLAREIRRATPRREAARLILRTAGGDPGAAYLLARALRESYRRLTVVVLEQCKSAGTLIALAADEIAFNELGELGPLDIQLAKTDEIIAFESGLNTIQAVDEVSRGVSDTFMDAMTKFSVNFTGLGLSSKMICSIAQHVAVEAWRPIASQIDPYKLADVRRSMNIASAYAERLTSGGRSNLKSNTLNRLIHGYPAHSFIIDKAEAETLFEEVKDAVQLDFVIAALCKDGLRSPQARPLGISASKDLEQTLRDLEAQGTKAPAEREGGQKLSATKKGEPNHGIGPQARESGEVDPEVRIPPVSGVRGAEPAARKQRRAHPTRSGLDEELGGSGSLPAEGLPEEELTDPASQ